MRDEVFGIRSCSREVVIHRCKPWSFKS